MKKIKEIVASSENKAFSLEKELEELKKLFNYVRLDDYLLKGAPLLNPSTEVKGNIYSCKEDFVLNQWVVNKAKQSNMDIFYPLADAVTLAKRIRELALPIKHGEHIKILVKEKGVTFVNGELTRDIWVEISRFNEDYNFAINPYMNTARWSNKHFFVSKN